jgi:hypothetical protein
MQHPDYVYDRTRLELLPYEDTEFLNLLSFVPNYYLSPNEQTLYGTFLQSLARELGRLEYRVNYSLVAKDTQYLTPSDVKRIYEDPAYINKEYPTADQYDNDYKNLVLRVVSAHALGSTTKSVEGIIQAYTGYATEVKELFKVVGQGIYDISDKNSINISISTPSGDLSKAIQIITKDLIASIMLAKPAHIGINLSTVFTEGPDTITSNITDELTIYFKLPEDDQLENEFIVGPFIDKAQEESLLAGGALGQGLLTPRQNTVWEIKSDTLIGLDID